MEANEPRVALVFKHPINPTHIPVDLALIICIEPRFWNTLGADGKSTIDAFLGHNHWNIVPLTEAGGVEILASEDPAKAERKSALLARIDQELGLHHPERLGFPCIWTAVHTGTRRPLAMTQQKSAKGFTPTCARPPHCSARSLRVA